MCRCDEMIEARSVMRKPADIIVKSEIRTAKSESKLHHFFLLAL